GDSLAKGYGSTQGGFAELASTQIEAGTSIVLHDKALIAKMQPELNLHTPSLMFFSNNLDQLYKDLAEKNVTVGQVVDLPTGRAFNFADNESNYFAVMERK
ncbi:hypothetical protein ACT453_09210, partial [Bacillus sp. D-CC]